MNEVQGQEGPDDDDEDMGSEEEGESSEEEEEEETADEEKHDDDSLPVEDDSKPTSPESLASTSMPVDVDVDVERPERGREVRSSELSPTSPQSPVPRNLSRSPPRSRSLSPDAIDKMTARMEQMDVKDIAAAEVKRQRERQHRKYHSKPSTRRAGRPKGSKAKQDTRVKMDYGGGWD